MIRRTAQLVLLATLAVAMLAGCTQLRYYAHLAGGQIELLRAREPIAAVLADPAADPTLKARLAQVVDARRWAVSALALPDNRSYTSYADLKRPYVVWNVFATPEFSLEPLQQCFLVAGCLAYQGFYERARAEERAAALRAQGYDVHVGGVPAYSTLGWFADPVLSTMLHWNDATLVGTVFHELAHQKLYVDDDTRFNESYAEFVEQQGLREYLAGHPQLDAPDGAAQHRQTRFVQLMLGARERLAALYAQPLRPEVMRQRKAAEFERLAAEYRRLRDGPWQGDARYDRWFAEPLPNNARLLPFGLYDEYVPAFEALFAAAGGSWPVFHARAAALGALPAQQREAELRALLRSRRPE